MYNPPHFEETRPEELRRIIDQHPLGILVTREPQGLDANHLPFEFDPEGGEHGRLLAHVARANPLWQEANDGDETLVIFRGVDSYISPNWYPSKHELHQQVPTWNYQVVHVHGKIKIRDDQKFLLGVVGRLTHKHEMRIQEPKPWTMSSSSKEFIDLMLTKIVGIEIEIVKMVGKSKLGQNKEDRDRLSAAEELRQHGREEISDAMLNAKNGKG